MQQQPFSLDTFDESASTGSVSRSGTFSQCFRAMKDRNINRINNLSGSIISEDKEQSKSFLSDLSADKNP
jgi:hypothetical protein